MADPGSEFAFIEAGITKHVKQNNALDQVLAMCHGKCRSGPSGLTHLVTF